MQPNPVSLAPGACHNVGDDLCGGLRQAKDRRLNDSAAIATAFSHVSLAIDALVQSGDEKHALIQLLHARGVLKSARPTLSRASAGVA